MSSPPQNGTEKISDASINKDTTLPPSQPLSASLQRLQNSSLGRRKRPSKRPSRYTMDTKKLSPLLYQNPGYITINDPIPSIRDLTNVAEAYNISMVNAIALLTGSPIGLGDMDIKSIKRKNFNENTRQNEK